MVTLITQKSLYKIFQDCYVKWTVERAGPWAHTINVFCDDYRESEVKLFFPGDIHHDSPKCNRKTLHKHLQRAVEENAIIISIGDQFDVMEGRYDPRRKTRKGVRPENDYPDYLDLVVRHFAEDMAPYAKNWAIMGLGNHETSILKNASTDLVERSIERFKMMKSPVIKGNYMGFILIRFIRPQKDKVKRSRVYRVYYHHGFGGGAPVTDGIIDLKRHKTFIEGVDMMVMGHKHTYLYKPEKVMRLTRSGKVVVKEVDLLRVDSYKDLYSPEGWAVEKGFKPPTIGGSMVVIRTDQLGNERPRHRFTAEITRWR